MKKYDFYLIGQTWYSAGHDGANTDTFPSFVTASASSAERKFRELEVRDKDWSYSFTHAYMVGVLPDGKFEFIKGKTNPLAL